MVQVSSTASTACGRPSAPSRSATHAITHASILEVPDTREDERFRHNPFVTGQPHIRFYAGAPLVTPDGHALGTLCVVDIEPRRLSPGQMRALDALRHQVQDQLELRLKLRQLEQALADRDTAQAEQAALIAELRSSLQKVDKLTALMPYTSTCEMNIVIPAERRASRESARG